MRSSHEGLASEAPAHAAARRPLRILVADDDPSIRLIMRLVLRRHGHEVVLAEDADAALREAMMRGFDAALIDARMPGNGVRLLRRLEEIPELSGRAVLMTGDDGGVPEHAAGDWPRLTKPFDYDEMVRLLERIAG